MKKTSADNVLASMSETFREKNKVYVDNYVMVGKVMQAFFPDGVVLASAADFELFHLFELKVVKLTRFIISGMKHIDSVHDDAVYSAMIEAILLNRVEQGRIQNEQA
jgi:hypothetical protein